MNPKKSKAADRLTFALALAAGAGLTGCASSASPDNCALTGSAGGAAVGAGIGSASGNAGRGALIGGAVGLTGGAVAGRNLEEQERSARPHRDGEARAD